jgi:hypothetical protein
MIKATKLIFNTDNLEFHKKLIEAIEKFQAQEYHVEVQYSCSISENDTLFSALVIGYSHTK